MSESYSGRSLHGNRRMWGPQTIVRMIAEGEIGDVISIDGRYWQSSAAQMATSQDPPATAIYTDIRGVIRYNTAGLATPSSPPID